MGERQAPAATRVDAAGMARICGRLRDRVRGYARGAPRARRTARLARHRRAARGRPPAAGARADGEAGASAAGLRRRLAQAQTARRGGPRDVGRISDDAAGGAAAGGSFRPRGARRSGARRGGPDRIRRGWTGRAGRVSRRGDAHGGVREPFGKEPFVNAHTRRTAVALLALALVAGCGYNTIQTLDERVNAAESQIKVQLQRRADLIPNLVETVKAYAKQEQTIFIQVAEARSRLAGAVQRGNLEQMAAANTALNAPLGRLLGIAENYPQLKSNENFRTLQDQLEGTENRIAVARQDYNESVNAYNAYIRRFPQVLTAKVLGKKPRGYFELQSPGAAEAPKVDFSR